jgi:predicted helicase
VLTDYLEFRWYVDGAHRLTARLAQQHKGAITFDAGGAAAVQTLLLSFLAHAPEPIRSPKVLAERMARLTHMIHDLALRTLALPKDAEGAEMGATLRSLHDAFTQTLIPDLSADAFADMFAQTLAYGLFAARVNHTGTQPFVRKDAAREVPRTNPFLRKLFETLNGTDLDEAPFVGFVDDLARLLNDADLAAILAQFGKRTRQDDPIVHFYETFLTAYDPKLRELRGVYYTPEPVVGYIVRSVDHLLRSEFGCADGLATGERLPDGNERVMVLDPACGTGTFLYNVIEQIRQSFGANAGMWPAYVRDHLLPRIVGFELLMAPYAMAHLKLGMQLAALDLPEATRARWAYAGEERLHVYLTNTLEEAKTKADLLMGRYISDEANEAAHVKRDKPVMVVLGNPPYSGHSANKGTWITDLLHGKDVAEGQARATGNYFAVDGQPLGERNPKWLNDDYVKFLRFAQWRIERTGHGILAFITNNGYLDNPTFRGMRQSLLHTFDDIYILDLHGNSKKKERHPDGSKDENVFDIQQGVAIGIFVKRQHASNRPKTIRHAHLYGPREGTTGKYAWLAEHDMTNTDWAVVNSRTPFYLLTSQDEMYQEEYEQGWRIADIMSINGWGIATRKDYLLVDFERKVLIKKFTDIYNLSTSEAIARYDIQESPHWNFATAKQQMSKDVEAHVRTVMFRPFDTRYIYYEKFMIERGDHRYDLMSNFFSDNLGFITVRRTEMAGEATHFFCTNDISVLHSTSSKEGNFVFPLYLYPDPSKPTMLDDQPPSMAPGGRRPNLAPEFIKECAARLGLAWVADGKGDREATFGPEDVFSYLYAVFHAPEYRARYAEYLKTDFPRLPLTRDVALFRELCQLGDELVALHLMERAAPQLPGFPEQGDNEVREVRWVGPGRVYINPTQYFDGVAPDVWEFHVGGYQVCHKWLKDRKGRTLSYDDLRHYQRIVGALGETLRLMGAIDEAIEAHGGWPLG